MSVMRSSPRRSPIPKSQNHKKACLGCRSIKVRCDRVEPDKVDSTFQCSRCARLKIPCVVQEHHRGRRSAANTRSNPTARPSGKTKQQGRQPMQLDVEEEEENRPSSSSQRLETSSPTGSGNLVPNDIYSSPPSTSAVASYSSLPGRLPESNIRDSANESTHEDYLRAPVAGSVSNSEHTTQSQPGQDQDPVSKRYLTVADARYLLSFYMKEMNAIFAFLDPILCTFEYLRSKSTILFTAILTVAAKFERKDVYHCLLTLSQEFLARVFISGASALEIIQAIRILSSYREHTDSSNYLKIGYAIRMAYDLGLDKPHKRPLPEDEVLAREILSRERCWFDLVCTDELVSRQRSRPLITSSDAVPDPRRWVEENVKYRLDTDPFIAAQLAVCGFESESYARLFSVNPPEFSVFAQRQGAVQAASRRANLWAEMWSRQRREDYPFRIHPTSLALLHHFRTMLDFHTAETYYRHISCRPKDVNDVGKEFPALVAVFGAAIAFFQVFVDDFKDGQLRYAPEYLFVGSAHVALWLFKSRSKMHPTMKTAVSSVLKKTADLFRSSARAPQESAAYQARFLEGLINAIETDNATGSSIASPRFSRRDVHPSMSGTGAGEHLAPGESIPLLHRPILSLFYFVLSSLKFSKRYTSSSPSSSTTTSSPRPRIRTPQSRLFLFPDATLDVLYIRPYASIVHGYWLQHRSLLQHTDGRSIPVWEPFNVVWD
ncbi:hypothetical protein K435DRAFT_836889 [Dendrothele bispora CBS 962.96]|uniref:Zn(2)-C6 fungal-type domain-containing protein n=1 Tax=Dendrothele bispora (strain CBS 962.96) TaxID=1314807 RepID=A0A4S8MFQ7_DENBC|nr:hypothetical protein K435DRAFT_836889 [Dendrothele bispora CBS 962.96]